MVTPVGRVTGVGFRRSRPDSDPDPADRGDRRRLCTAAVIVGKGKILDVLCKGLGAAAGIARDPFLK